MHAERAGHLHAEAGDVAEERGAIDHPAELDDDDVTWLQILAGPDVVLVIPVAFLGERLDRLHQVGPDRQVAHRDRAADELRVRNGQLKAAFEDAHVPAALERAPHRLEGKLAQAAAAARP